MARNLLAFFFFVICSSFPIHAQEQTTVWVQIEARPSLAQAQLAIREYSTELQDVNGFTLRGGWYAVALGPYTQEQAEQVLRVYQTERVIPQDAYISQTSDYRQQFWPVGTNLLASAPLEINQQIEQDTTPPEETQTVETEFTEETLGQARANESRLTRAERADLQIALKWAGFYGGVVDAAFGRGTRGSMARWQEAYGYKPTGTLTTRQRAELLQQYNAVLKGLDLQLILDESAGIEIKLPMGVVAFDRYEPPFAHYNATGDLDARILLISQKGDKNTLAGLYDIMQTLEIVPASGPRNLGKDTFTLIGEGALFVSHTQAWLKDGEIKGFTLIWPAGDEERRARLLGAMQGSFNRISGVLNADAGLDSYQQVDLISGLEVRKPKVSRSGFFVDQRGSVVTTSDILQGCTKITIDRDHLAEVTTQDDSLGIVVLRPTTGLAPRSFAFFQQNQPRLQSDIAVAGYSYSGLLSAPIVTFGQLADHKGLNGETGLKRLALAPLDGDAGGAVVDAGGAVLGMLLPEIKDARTLPPGVSFAVNSDAVQSVLQKAGITPVVKSDLERLAPEVLTNQALRI